MDGTPDNFEQFWESHCLRFLEENNPSEVYPPPCENPYFPWSLSERKIYRGKGDWVNARKMILGEHPDHYVKGPDWFEKPRTVIDKSKARNGFVMWDRCVITPRQHDNVMSAGQAGGTYSNTDWMSILSCLNNVTTTKRPSGEFVFDVMNSSYGWEIMNTAHILTHKLQDVGYYSSTSTVLAAFVLKLCLALKYDLVVDMDPNKDKTNSKDSLDIIGCKIHMSSRLRSPMLDIPCSGKKTLVADKDNLVISGSVQFEPQPNPNNVTANKWMEVNRWSCLPTIVCFAGWQTSDFITHAQLVKYGKRKDLYWELPVQSLEPPKWFSGILQPSEPDNIRYFRLVDFWESNKYKVDCDLYPTLPCRSCMKVNPQIEGYPQKPPGEPTKTQAWVTYTEGMEAIFKTCQKAAVYQEGRKKGHTKVKRHRKQAQVNYAELKRLKDKLKKMEEKIVQKRANGYISESRKLRIQAAELRGKISRLEEGEPCED